MTVNGFEEPARHRSPSDNPNSSLPSLPTALQEKFGLELKSFTGPIDTFIIDHAERPSPD